MRRVNKYLLDSEPDKIFLHVIDDKYNYSIDYAFDRHVDLIKIVDDIINYKDDYSNVITYYQKDKGFNA